MFIDSTMNPGISAPAERDVFFNGADRFTFRSSGCEEESFEVAGSINVTSLYGTGNRFRRSCSKKDLGLLVSPIPAKSFTCRLGACLLIPLG
jgi:hypothetical protein